MVGSYIWDLGFPINKKLWTSSYVLLTVGINLAMLGALIYAIDFKIPPINFNFFFEILDNGLIKVFPMLIR